MRLRVSAIMAFASLFIVLCCGCKGGNGRKVLSQYTTPYTVAYDNLDGTYSFYIYTSPVFYKADDKYCAIDNNIIKSNHEGYAYENKSNSIKTYFPDTLSDCILIEYKGNTMKIRPKFMPVVKSAKNIDYRNIYGDEVSAVIYEGTDCDYVFYPTKAGIRSEIIVKKKLDDTLLSFYLEAKNVTTANLENRYVTLHQNGEKYGIIHSPIVSRDNHDQDHPPSIIFNNLLRIESNGDEHLIKISMEDSLFDDKNNFPVRIDMPIEYYINKIPDTGVYSAKPDTNAYLLSYSPIGATQEWGESFQYIRLRTNYYMETIPDDIISVKYCTSVLSNPNSPINIGLYNATQNWSSIGMTWNDKIEYGDKICDKTVEKRGKVEFDITDFVKTCVKDETDTKESSGFIMKSDGDSGNAIFASHENVLAEPHYIITLRKLPYSFEPHEEINPPIP